MTHSAVIVNLQNNLGLMYQTVILRVVGVVLNLNCEKTCEILFFCHRVVNISNSLPDYVAEADSINSFKSRLDKH